MDTTMDNGTAPAIVDTTPEVEVTKTRKTRRSPNDEQIATIKSLRAAGVTFSEVARQTGFSVGTVQKFAGDGAPSKPKGAKRGPKPKTASAPATSSGRLDTVMAVRLAMADLLFAGHAVAEIRGALASLNLAH